MSRTKHQNIRCYSCYADLDNIPIAYLFGKSYCKKCYDDYKAIEDRRRRQGKRIKRRGKFGGFY